MSTRQKSARKRQPAAPNGTASGTEQPPELPRQSSPAQVGVEGALDECVGAICLAEVALRSLESKDVAFAEQEVLKRAVKAMWVVHDWMVDLPPGTPGAQTPDEQDLDEQDLDEEDES